MRNLGLISWTNYYRLFKKMKGQARSRAVGVALMLRLRIEFTRPVAVIQEVK